MEQYLVHNGARDPETRTQRAQNAQHRGLKQFIPIGQQRVLRGRPVMVTKQQLAEHIKAMQALQDAGVIYVTTMDGRVVDLYTGNTQGPAVEPPKPNSPLDSAANDKAGGQDKLNQYGMESPPPAEFKMPVAAPMAAFVDTPKVIVPDVTEPSVDEVLAEAEAEPESPEDIGGMPTLSPQPTPSYSKKGKR